MDSLAFRLPADTASLAAEALGYIGVLAFPEREDWREDLFHAVHAACNQAKPINTRRVAAIDRAVKRLAMRLEAVSLFRPVLMANANPAFLRFSLKDADGRFEPTITGMASRHDRADKPNVLARIWKPSAPVIHMALGFANHAPDEATIVRLVRNPSWLPPAVRASLQFGALIEAQYPQAGPLIPLRIDN